MTWLLVVCGCDSGYNDALVRLSVPDAMRRDCRREDGIWRMSCEYSERELRGPT